MCYGPNRNLIVTLQSEKRAFCVYGFDPSHSSVVKLYQVEKVRVFVMFYSRKLSKTVTFRVQIRNFLKTAIAVCISRIILLSDNIGAEFHPQIQMLEQRCIKIRFVSWS